MVAVVKKWGNSLGIRIPNLVARSMNFSDGSRVELKSTDEGILIAPKQSPKLSVLLAEIAEQNVHGEVKTGQPVGKEIL
jgi:antitoxin MazE